MLFEKMDFQRIDELYGKSDFHEDDNILNILEAHKSIEQTFTVEMDGIFLNHDFHIQNIEIIDYLIENINIGYFKSDAVIYLYSYMVYRYTETFMTMPQ